MPPEPRRPVDPVTILRLPTELAGKGGGVAVPATRTGDARSLKYEAPGKDRGLDGGPARRTRRACGWRCVSVRDVELGARPVRKSHFVAVGPQDAHRSYDRRLGRHQPRPSGRCSSGKFRLGQGPVHAEGRRDRFRYQAVAAAEGRPRSAPSPAAPSRGPSRAQQQGSDQLEPRRESGRGGRNQGSGPQGTAPDAADLETRDRGRQARFQ